MTAVKFKEYSLWCVYFVYPQKSQPVANGWLLAILDFNTHKTIAQDSYKSHHVHPAQYPDNAA